jgi:hypothetical protein
LLKKEAIRVILLRLMRRKRIHAHAEAGLRCGTLFSDTGRALFLRIVFPLNHEVKDGQCRQVEKEEDEKA